MEKEAIKPVSACLIGNHKCSVLATNSITRVQFAVYNRTWHVNVSPPVTLRKQVSAVTSLSRKTSSGTDMFVRLAVRTTSNEPWHTQTHTVSQPFTFSSTSASSFSQLSRKTLQLVSWSLTSLFSTNMSTSETKGQGWKVIHTQSRKASDILTSTLAAFLFSSHPKKGKGSRGSFKLLR